MKAYEETVRLPSLPINYIIRYGETIQGDVFVHPHWHNIVEVLFYERGRTKQQSGEHIFTTNPGDIVVIWSNQIHSTYKYGDEPCVIKVYQFPHHELWENEIINSLGFVGSIGAGHPHWAQIDRILEGISSELDQKQDGFEYKIVSYKNDFFAFVIRNRAELPIETKFVKSHTHTMTKFFDYIDDHYSGPLTLKMAAEAVFLSTAQFTRVIKSATGMTFKTYLNLYRIDQSTKLLRQGCTVAQTAERCGFQSVNTFIRVFKQVKKCTPSLYKSK